MAAVCDLLRIVKCLLGIWKQCAHFILGLYIILPAFITHAVFVLQLFRSLYTEQDIMRLDIFRIRIMHIICRHQLNACLLTQPKQLRIHHFLLRHAVILQLQEKISFPKTCLIFERGFFCLFIAPAL